MKKNLIFLAAFLFAVEVLALNPETAPNVTDAVTKAAESNQDAVLFFYGPDWDVKGGQILVGGWKNASKKLAPWTSAAIPIFDLDDTDAKKKLTEKNKKFKYKIWNYPAVAYCDSMGDVVLVREGLNANTSETAFGAFAAEGKKLRERRDAFFAKAVDAKGTEKAKLLGQGLTVMTMPCANTYRDRINEIKKSDPDNVTGYADIFHFSLDATIDPVVKVKADDTEAFETQEKRLDKMLMNPVRPNDQKQIILGAKYALYERTKHFGDADKALKEIIRIDAKSDYGIAAKTILDKGISRPKK